MEIIQVAGVIIGALAGHLVAAMIAGGSYTYIGGNVFEVTEEPLGCIQGCLVEIIAVGLGAGAGYIITYLIG